MIEKLELVLNLNDKIFYYQIWWHTLRASKAFLFSYSYSASLFLILANYHCPETNPLGRQKHKYFKQSVSLNTFIGKVFPLTLLINSFEKWLQLLEKTLYYPQVNCNDIS
jgi:hypothetical protein